MFGDCFLAVITGGLDSKVVMWDFSKGRPYKIVDFGIYFDAHFPLSIYSLWMLSYASHFNYPNFDLLPILRWVKVLNWVTNLSLELLEFL